MNDLAERRQEEKDRRRADILDAAEFVAGELGWDEMTMDQLARKARVSRPLLYVYFKDKTDLMFGVAERALAALYGRFEAAAASHARGLDQVHAIGRAYVTFSQECPLYFSILSLCELEAPGGADAGTNEGVCMQRGDALQGLLVTALRVGQRDGSVRTEGTDPEMVAVALWGFMHGVISLVATKGNVLAHRGIVIERLMDQALLMATRSIAASEIR